MQELYDIIRIHKNGVGPEGSGWVVSTYSWFPQSAVWVSRLRRRLPGLKIAAKVSPEKLDQRGHKGTLHPQPPGAKVDDVMTLPRHIVRARGFRCRTNEELCMSLEEFRKMKSMPETVVLKPIWGTDGDGIEFLPTDQDKTMAYLKHYDVAKVRGAVLEEKLKLDIDAFKDVVSPVVHFMDGRAVWPGLVDQVLIGSQYIGSSFPSAANPTVVQRCLKTADEAMRALDVEGPGGFDFLLVDGIPHLSDINLGRWNGGHYPRAFIYSKMIQIFGNAAKVSEVSFITWRQLLPGLTPKQVEVALEEAGLNLKLSSTVTLGGKVSTSTLEGAVPMLYIRDFYGSFCAFGRSPLSAKRLRLKAMEVLDSVCREYQASLKVKDSDPSAEMPDPGEFPPVQSSAGVDVTASDAEAASKL
eukprot:NODE_682_length_1859_cov_6.334254_g553_i0.p1 GENE.NODE_682_length_1859_cov_6.334254_g553_i0~~NODE_682_length_1859_cov_6.334254_g553_i0.p1  ORF type:complete len:421 (+),score=149.30 NODE_682_length_1859_cov_6.334254_g553_i0:26-1264(+)